MNEPWTTFKADVQAMLDDEENWHEDCTKPTEEAVAELYRLLDGISFPQGYITGGDGQIRVEWHNEENGKKLRLQIMGITGGKHYLYWEGDGDYGCVYRPTPQQVAEWIGWYTR